MTTTTDIDNAIARVAAVLAELREARDAEVTPAAINADGSPGTVAAGELIESAWGNATANTIGKLKGAQRYSAALSLALVTADTTGVWISGNLAVPTAAYRRLALVTVNVLLTSTGDVDLALYAAGPVLMRRGRHPSVQGQGASLAITTQTAIAANEAQQYAAKLAAISGTIQTQLMGSADFNYIDVLTVPTLTT